MSKNKMSSRKVPRLISLVLSRIHFCRCQATNRGPLTRVESLSRKELGGVMRRYISPDILRDISGAPSMLAGVIPGRHRSLRHSRARSAPGWVQGSRGHPRRFLRRRPPVLREAAEQDPFRRRQPQGTSVP